jgi:hypothetical protein
MIKDLRLKNGSDRDKTICVPNKRKPYKSPAKRLIISCLLKSKKF